MFKSEFTKSYQNHSTLFLLPKILPTQKKFSLTQISQKELQEQSTSHLAFFNSHEEEELCQRIKQIIQLFTQLFSLRPTVPDNLNQFIGAISKNLDYMSLDAIQSYNIIPYLAEILNSDPNEQILCIVLMIIDYLLNLDFTVLSILDQYQIFVLLSNFFDTANSQLRIKLAKIFHSAVFYDNSNNVNIFDAFEKERSNPDNQENGSETEAISSLSIEIFNKISSLFFQQSYIWAADVSNEELQFICLDFELIIIDIVYSYDSLFEPLSDQTITTLSDLYSSIFQVGSERLKVCSLTCLIKLVIGRKAILFEPIEMITVSLGMIKLEDRYIDHCIFRFLSTTILLISETNQSISFLHQFFDFNFLCEKMSVSSNIYTLYYLCLLLNLFVNNGPESIELILQANFIEYAKQKLDQGIVNHCEIISGSFKDIFLLATPQQLMFVFQSGIIRFLLQFFDYSYDDTTSAVLNAMCFAVQKCTNDLGQEVFQKIQNIFLNESYECLLNLQNCDYDVIVENADNLIELLNLG